jgi:hypothetical protein
MAAVDPDFLRATDCHIAYRIHDYPPVLPLPHGYLVLWTEASDPYFFLLSFAMWGYKRSDFRELTGPAAGLRYLLAQRGSEESSGWGLSD